MSGLPAYYKVVIYSMDDVVALETIRGEEVARFFGMTPMENVRRAAHAHDEIRQLLVCEREAKKEPDTPEREAYLKYLSARLARANEAYRRELIEARRAAKERRRIA